MTDNTQQAALLCTYGEPSKRKPVWMLRFEDQDKGVNVYHDEAEAHAAFQQATLNWNCTLFVTARAPVQQAEVGEDFDYKGFAEAWHRATETILTMLGLSCALGADEAVQAVQKYIAIQAAGVGAVKDDGMVLLPVEALYYINATEFWALDPQDAKERTHYLRRKMHYVGLPMETAPPDKRDVLLFCGQWVCGRRSDDMKDPERLLSGYTTDCTWPGMTQPTAWLPLPKYAASPGKERGA